MTAPRCEHCAGRAQDRAAYNRGCRCPASVAAANAYKRAYRGNPRRPSAASRQAFQGRAYDPEKAKRSRKDRPRAPLTPAERLVLAELLGRST